MERFYTDRTRLTKEALNKYCTIEKSYLQQRMNALAVYESSFMTSEMDEGADRLAFLQRYKRPERTHRYSRALTLMDWDIERRYDSLPLYICLTYYVTSTCVFYVRIILGDSSGLTMNMPM